MRIHKRKFSTTCFRKARGFGIVELMVALVITLILLGGIGQIFLSSKKSFTIQSTLSRQQENGRFAINIIAQDLRRAGYYGGNAVVSSIQDALGKVAENFSCPNGTGDTTWGRMLDHRIYGINNAKTGYSCIPNTGVANGYLRGDVVVVRYAAPYVVGGITTPGEPVDADDPAKGSKPLAADDNRIFIRSTVFQGKIFKGSDTETNEIESGSRRRLSELIAHAYYIGDSGQTCQGAAVPSLFRVTLSNNGTPKIEEIAYGIEQLQIRYGIDTAIDLNASPPDFEGDSTINQYMDAGSINDDNSAPYAAPYWAQVIATKVWLLTRAECPETGYTNNQTYDDGSDTVDYTVSDAYRRQQYETTVWLRNLTKR